MDNLIRRQLGSYLLLELVGQGDYTQVYLAEHYSKKERVVLKVLNPHLYSTTGRMFSDAVGTMARLDHPHIIRILDLGIETSRISEQDIHTLFFAMPYAFSGSMRQHYRRGMPVSLPIVIKDVQQIAQALQFAHTQGVLHQRLKPENILFGVNNEILLSDFGFSYHQEMTIQTSLASALYTAPEQIRGKPSMASDQYALGAIMYESISGLPPFIGSIEEIAQQHLNSKPPPFREKGLNLSLGVEQVVMRALEKDPHKRFPDIASFASALESTSHNDQNK